MTPPLAFASLMPPPFATFAAQRRSLLSRRLHGMPFFASRSMFASISFPAALHVAPPFARRCHGVRRQRSRRFAERNPQMMLTAIVARPILGSTNEVAALARPA